MNTMQDEEGIAKGTQDDPRADDKDQTYVLSRPLGDIPASSPRQHGGSIDSVTSAGDPGTDADIDLTVNKKWKVDEKLHEKMLASNKPTILVPIVKWICTFLLGLAILACVSASKLSIISLAAKLNVNTTGKTDSDARSERVEATRIFIMISLILLVPYCFNFLRAGFFASCRKDMPWPNGKPMIIVSIFTCCS